MHNKEFFCKLVYEMLKEAEDQLGCKAIEQRGFPDKICITLENREVWINFGQVEVIGNEVFHSG